MAVPQAGLKLQGFRMVVRVLLTVHVVQCATRDAKAVYRGGA